ncbi:hypothetical protein FSPOR_3298 [Fusarium sporotrichioides]|uniref:Uncharacterized protein n=1 Tax=Fusarium sporotrichioides TaxID=5514 RepID=A0A395SGG0_FUSSP|nr:hypothetical protein FSPOR_3298 [Fusarium sporotrichioides]
MDYKKGQPRHTNSPVKRSEPPSFSRTYNQLLPKKVPLLPRQMYEVRMLLPLFLRGSAGDTTVDSLFSEASWVLSLYLTERNIAFKYSNFDACFKGREGHGGIKYLMGGWLDTTEPLIMFVELLTMFEQLTFDCNQLVVRRPSENLATRGIRDESLGGHFFCHPLGDKPLCDVSFLVVDLSRFGVHKGRMHFAFKWTKTHDIEDTVQLFLSNSLVAGGLRQSPAKCFNPNIVVHDEEDFKFVRLI